jgi:hypothetical protein
LVKPHKNINKGTKVYEASSSDINDGKFHIQRLSVIVDGPQESQNNYRELDNIRIDPQYIIEEQQKRQPLAFLE